MCQRRGAAFWSRGATLGSSWKSIQVLRGARARKLRMVRKIAFAPKIQDNRLPNLHTSTTRTSGSSSRRWAGGFPLGAELARRSEKIGSAPLDRERHYSGAEHASKGRKPRKHTRTMVTAMQQRAGQRSQRALGLGPRRCEGPYKILEPFQASRKQRSVLQQQLATGGCL